MRWAVLTGDGCGNAMCIRGENLVVGGEQSDEARAVAEDVGIVCWVGCEGARCQ